MGSKAIKIMLVGDGYTGKTCLLFAFRDRQYSVHKPTVFETHTMDFAVAGKEHKIMLVDTAGQEDYDMIRVLAYKDCNVFVLCYSVDSRKSFENVRDKWIKELKHYSDDCKVILVATKTDLRKEKKEDIVTAAEGQAMRREIKAYSFVECSAKTLNNVDKVFQDAVAALLLPKPPKDSCCILH